MAQLEYTAPEIVNHDGLSLRCFRCARRNSPLIRYDQTPGEPAYVCLFCVAEKMREHLTLKPLPYTYFCVECKTYFDDDEEPADEAAEGICHTCDRRIRQEMKAELSQQGEPT